MARPTLYNEKILTDSREYLARPVESYKVIEKPFIKDGKVYGVNDEVVKEVNVPTLEGLATFLDISRDTLYAWRKEHEEFSYIIDKLLQKQTFTLINKGLSNEYNANITKAIISKQGYSERTETDITTSGEKINMTPEALALTNKFEDELKKTL